MREIEDIGDTALSYAEVKALAAGDTRLMEKAKLEGEVVPPGAPGAGLASEPARPPIQGLARVAGDAAGVRPGADERRQAMVADYTAATQSGS